MKRILLVVSILSLVFTKTFAQNPAYVSAMENAVGLLSEFENTENNKQAVNQLERIAAAEPKEWLPSYWAAYGLINLNYAEADADKKDIILDKADKFLAIAEKLQPNNDEIEVMKAYLASARMAVAPQDRWQKYGGMVGSALKNATKLNPENPRAKLLEAQGIYYTPEAFGGGKKKSQPIFEEALNKFSKFNPATSIAPNWGERVAKWMLSQI
jgi:cytochrome c-type biogenesis protein CcmH/NrfG